MSKKRALDAASVAEEDNTISPKRARQSVSSVDSRDESIIDHCDSSVGKNRDDLRVRNFRSRDSLHSDDEQVISERLDSISESESHPDDVADAVLADLARSRERGHSLSGVLEKVQLNRFMSHDCFEYTLGPNVNIINGPNGSGKSAIVAAVQIGLGARASSTERAARLDDHIMFGKRDAIISIKIRNRRDPSEVDLRTSDDDSSSYKWSIFGDAIIIERTLVRDSPGSWTLKDARGRNVLNKLCGVSARREVMNICDHFGFMVENPVAVLTQTRTKAFLAECKPQHHYKLFREATLLGPLSFQLSKTAEACKDIERILCQKRQMTPLIQKQLQDIKTMYEESKEMKNLGTRLQDMEVLLAWTFAVEEENHLRECERVTKDEFEADLAKMEERETKLLRDIDSVDEEMNVANAAVQEHTRSMRDANIALQSARTSHDLRKRELSRKLREKEEFKLEMEDKLAGRRNAISRRDKARLQHMNSQKEKTRFVKDLEETLQGVSNAEEEVRKAEATLAREEELFRAASDETCTLRRNVESLQRAFESKRRDTTVQRQYMNNANHVGRFGRHFTNVMPLLESYVKAGRFHFPPVGPLGQYISVRNDEWAPTIQDAIGSQILLTFLLADSHDMKVLRTLFQEVKAGVPKTILIGGLGFSRPRYNIAAQHIPNVRHLGHHTVMDMLDVKNDAVFNALVDHCRIESNVLVKGEEAMVKISRMNDPNIRVCWDENGSRAYVRNGASTFRAPPNDRRSHTCSLTSDRVTHVAALEDAVTTLGAERMEAEKILQNHLRRVSVLSNNERHARESLHLARQTHQTNLLKYDELENKMAAAASEFDSSSYDEDIQAYEIDAKDAEARMKAAEAMIAELTISVQKLNDDERGARERFERLKFEGQSKSEELSLIGNKLIRDKAALRRVSNEKKVLQEKVEKAHKEIADHRTYYAKVLADARALREKMPDMSEGKSSEKLSAELKGIQRRLEQEEERRDGKSADDIEMEYLTATKKNKENQAMVRRIEMYAAALNRGLEMRKGERSQIEARIKKIVRQNFNLFLMTRGHRGKITFKKNDKGEPELVITTQMAAHKTGDGELHRTKDLRSLSGGERSYTTLSFMLALGEVCQNPVRIMDEPDVFLDEASRNAAFRTLIEFCSSHLPDRQIILVTPLTLPEGVNVTDSVRIVKLSNVRRSRDSVNQPQTQTHMDAFLKD